MKPRPLCNKLNEMLERGLERGVFLAIQTHVLAGPLGRESLGPTTTLGMVADFGINLHEFVKVLDEGRYSAVFSNYAILRIECSFDSDRLRRHRYSYIPCPVEPTSLLGRPPDKPIVEWIVDVVSAGGDDLFRSLGAYRFDFDSALLNSAVEGHPASHLTFVSPECRMPVRSPMSISHFMNFIFDNFYKGDREFWLDYAPFLSSYGIEDTITEGEQLLHHIYWRDEL